jgi:hypothetical protein
MTSGVFVAAVAPHFGESMRSAIVRNGLGSMGEVKRVERPLLPPKAAAYQLSQSKFSSFFSQVFANTPLGGFDLSASTPIFSVEFVTSINAFIYIGCSRLRHPAILFVPHTTCY